MGTDQLNRWLTLVAHVGVIAGLVFVALEVQTNTESNDIAIEENYATNWMVVNSTVAGNPQLAEILERGLAGEELQRAEFRQLKHLVKMYLTQSFYMLRLFDRGLITEDEVRGAFRAVRELAERGRFREIIENEVGSGRAGRLILDPNGLDRWLNAEQ